jgi:hypothetical protein
MAEGVVVSWQEAPRVCTRGSSSFDDNRRSQWTHYSVEVSKHFSFRTFWFCCVFRAQRHWTHSLEF